MKPTHEPPQTATNVHTDELPPGRWERRGLVAVFVATDPEATKHNKPGPKPRPEKYIWGDQDLRDAHTRYLYGERDDYIREGERVYQRTKKREERAARRAMNTGRSAA